MSYRPEDHTWALCAYGESPYLEECIRSLKGQTVKTRILMATATPSPFLDDLAEKYGLPLYINRGEHGIGVDWNFAYEQAETPLVTIAHQDDLYDPEYAEEMLKRTSRSKDPILYFSDYHELRNGEKVCNNRNMKIKRMMLFPLRGPVFRNSRWMRRRILSLGSPICCPAVTYVKAKTGKAPFSTTMKVSLDWDQWEKQSRKKGAFVYSPRRLMEHRVHEDSATTKLIQDHSRGQEDLEMFRRFWPDWIAKRLSRAYAASEKSNQV